MLKKNLILLQILLLVIFLRLLLSFKGVNSILNLVKNPNRLYAIIRYPEI